MGIDLPALGIIVRLFRLAKDVSHLQGTDHRLPRAMGSQIEVPESGSVITKLTRSVDARPCPKTFVRVGQPETTRPEFNGTISPICPGVGRIPIPLDMVYDHTAPAVGVLMDLPNGSPCCRGVRTQIVREVLCHPDHRAKIDQKRTVLYLKPCGKSGIIPFPLPDGSVVPSSGKRCVVRLEPDRFVGREFQPYPRFKQGAFVQFKPMLERMLFPHRLDIGKSNKRPQVIGCCVTCDFGKLKDSQIVIILFLLDSLCICTALKRDPYSQ